MSFLPEQSNCSRFSLKLLVLEMPAFVEMSTGVPRLYRDVCRRKLEELGIIPPFVH